MWQLTPPTNRFFNDEQREQVRAIFRAILPGSETAPGADDANAVEYLDRLLAMDGSTYYEIPDWQKLYPAGLAALNQAGKKLYGETSAELTSLKADQMNDLLAQLSEGKLSDFPAGFDQKKFFAALRSHCIEGCFADPRWGGNSNQVIWDWYGFPAGRKEFRRNESGVLEEV